MNEVVNLTHQHKNTLGWNLKLIRQTVDLV